MSFWRKTSAGTPAEGQGSPSPTKARQRRIFTPQQDHKRGDDVPELGAGAPTGGGTETPAGPTGTPQPGPAAPTGGGAETPATPTGTPQPSPAAPTSTPKLNPGAAVAEPTRRPLKSLLREARWMLLLAAILITFLALISPRSDETHYPGDPTSDDSNGTSAAINTVKRLGTSVKIVEPASMPKISTEDVVLFTSHLNGATDTEVVEKAKNAKRIVVDAWSAANFRAGGDDAEFVFPMEQLDHSDSEYATDETNHFRATTSAYCADIVGSIETVVAADVLASDFIPEATDCISVGQDRVISVLKPSGDLPQIVVISSLELFYNSNIAQADNAAIALNLLQSDSRLVVVRPPSENLFGEFQSLIFRVNWTILPEFTYPLLLALLVVTVAHIIYRARRFGPLAYERLPVSIDSTETAHALGALLAGSKETAPAAQMLQTHARRQIARKLGVSVAAEPDQLIRAFTQTTQTTTDEKTIHRLLYQPFTGKRADLITWADELGALLEEVTND